MKVCICVLNAVVREQSSSHSGVVETEHLHLAASDGIWNVHAPFCNHFPSEPGSTSGGTSWFTISVCSKTLHWNWLELFISMLNTVLQRMSQTTHLSSSICIRRCTMFDLQVACLGNLEMSGNLIPGNEISRKCWGEKSCQGKLFIADFTFVSMPVFSRLLQTLCHLC